MLTAAAVPAPLRPWLRRAGQHHQTLLLGLWLLVQVGFLVKFQGPHYANDSARYLEYSTNVARHGYYKILDPTDTYVYEHTQRYIAYAWFQSIWLRLGTGWWGIILAQIAVSGLAVRALYDAGRRLSGGRRGAAALATGLFILWPDVQQFNCYLLTESLFTSLSVLSFAALVRVRAGGWPAWAALLALLLLTALTRPNGFVVGGAALLAGLAALWQRPDRRWFWRALSGLVLAAPLLLLLLNQRLHTFRIIETYQRGEIMFGSRVWAQHSNTLRMPPPGTGQLARVFYFAVHNPGFLLQLMLGKLFAFFSGLKPYYSLMHRLLNVLVLWPAYWLAGRGARRAAVWLPARTFLLAVPLLQAAVVMLTVEDWDVRFLAPVLPFVFLLAALGVRMKD